MVVKMVNMINKGLFYAKIILLLFVFTMTLYIMFMMQDYYGDQIGTLISTFLPLFMVLVIFVVSFFFKEGSNNTLFNVACFLAFLAIAIIDFRTIFDKNMVLWVRGNLNFYYFENQISQIKIFSYLIFLGNLILIYKEKKKDIKIN